VAGKNINLDRRQDNRMDSKIRFIIQRIKIDGMGKTLRFKASDKKRPQGVGVEKKLLQESAAHAKEK